jgi:hypothetical protein
MGSSERGDRLKTFARLFLVAFLLAAPFSHISRAAAQQEGSLVLGAPNTASFPSIQFRLDAYDPQGGSISTLKAQDAQVIEDKQALKPTSFEKVANKLQVIVAINVGPVMAKPVNGAAGFKILQQALIDWTKNLAAGDDFSFATPTGLTLIHERNLSKVTEELRGYKPDLLHAQPALGSLAEALDLATDPLDQSSAKRAILYITPALSPTANATILDLTKRARGVGVRINVWQVADPTAKAGEVNPSNPFEQMAALTGGQFEEINLAGPLPEMEPLFQPLRSSYWVTYTSAIQKTGTHSLSVQIKQLGMTLVSVESSFSLSVQPPNPIFLSPPTSIQRYWNSEQKDAAPTLAPEDMAVQIMVEFPDQHRRALKATRLYVDDKMVAENTTEPFDRFTWPLAGETISARRMLRVEAVDALNLSGTSIELPIDVMVDLPAKAHLAEGVSTQGIIAVAAVAAAGLVLTLVLVLTSTQRRARRKRQQVDKRLLKDPVTQPVTISQDHKRPAWGQSAAKKAAQGKPPSTGAGPARSISTWSNPIWPRGNNSNVPARLVALDENEQPITGGAILLARQEITFGTNPQRATQVLDSPTVNELHARLYRDPDGGFFLADQNSIAGTWINYAPVNSSGARLEHGDLLHIGKVMFRFEMTNPPQVDIKVIDLEQLP